MAETIRVRTRVVAGKGEEGKSFRRAGIEHTTEWAEHEVTAGQLGALEAEPMVEVEEAGEAEPTSKDFKVDEAVAAIHKVEAVEALKEFVEGDTRKTVLEAAEKRTAELEEKAG